jgi:nitrous oxide reductase accessory protein NosL
MAHRPPRTHAGAILLALTLVAPAASASSAEAAPPRGAAASQGAGSGGAVSARPAAGDKCPVCGMFVAKYPDWVAGLVFKDGTVAWFDGAKDLFKFLLKPERYAPSRRAGDVARVWVTDYYSLKLLDAHQAWFVIGSDVYGPMGTELVPFAREEDALEFKADHKGTGLLRFGDVGPATLRQLQEPE